MYTTIILRFAGLVHTARKKPVKKWYLALATILNFPDLAARLTESQAKKIAGKARYN